LYIHENNDRIIYIKNMRNPNKGGNKMDEKIYKTMGSAGASTLAVGICVLAGGITAGILLIVNGARLLKNRSKIMF
jgi:cytochrome c biogenesis protein, transmembrane region